MKSAKVWTSVYSSWTGSAGLVLEKRVTWNLNHITSSILLRQRLYFKESPGLGLACWGEKPSDTFPGSYFGNCHSHIGMVTTAMQMTSPKPTFVKSANW